MTGAEAFAGFVHRVDELTTDLSKAGMRWHVRFEDPEAGLTAEFTSEKRPRR